jgi:RimJ/RimL family protein N-acetyltransferase
MASMSETRASWPVATWLRGDRYGLRAPVPADAECAIAWYEGAFPIAAATARELLTAQETIPWGANPTIRLMVVVLVTDEVVGGVLVERQDDRVGKLQIVAGGPHGGDEAGQQLRAAVLRLLMPWVMGELNMMVAVIDVPADETILIDAARELGLVEVVRLREQVARPGGRVDLLSLERVNRQWGRGDA